VRSEAAKDRDRILYSTAFRRLAGVTQVVEPREPQLFHNRLTHSVKVAQVGRSLADALLQTQEEDRVILAGGIDPTVVEAACYAHDLGHPPFGHLGETVLQEKLKSFDPPLDSFEGNAQSFRIVTKLAVRTVEAELGLDLTRATLRAVLKYPWTKPNAPKTKLNKWGAYLSEASTFDWAASDLGIDSRSAEAALMDLADDITYAVHDVEDFFRGGLIPLDRIATSDHEVERFTDSAWPRLERKGYDTAQLTAALDYLRGALLPDDPYSGTRDDKARLNVLASTLITRFIVGTTLTEAGVVAIGDAERHEIAVLKELTMHYVIESPSLTTLRHGQRDLVSKLYDAADGWAIEAGSTGLHQLPAALRESVSAILDDPEAAHVYQSGENLRRRAVADYLSSLTELQAIKLHERVVLGASQSAFEPWLRP
jgi:dGTPase